mgnify:FL=1|tara:strand:- start:492 stop:983 length:492 start_codon:yes stop_codon:yes gene_type:complete
MSLLNDVEKINETYKLTDPKIIEFHPALVGMMTVREHDRVFFDTIPEFPTILEGYSKMGPAYAAVHHGRPVGIFGCIPLWEGVAECWLITDVNLTDIARPFHRVTKHMFDLFMSELNLVRLQVTVHSQNVLALKWIKTLYFKEEGRLEKYGPDGQDFIMFART